VRAVFISVGLSQALWSRVATQLARCVGAIFDPRLQNVDQLAHIVKMTRLVLLR